LVDGPATEGALKRWFPASRQNGAENLLPPAGFEPFSSFWFLTLTKGSKSQRGHCTEPIRELFSDRTVENRAFDLAVDGPDERRMIAPIVESASNQDRWPCGYGTTTLGRKSKADGNPQRY
jgi:hypothetical protein